MGKGHIFPQGRNERSKAHTIGGAAGELASIGLCFCSFLSHFFGWHFPTFFRSWNKTWSWFVPSSSTRGAHSLSRGTACVHACLPPRFFWDSLSSGIEEQLVALLPSVHCEESITQSSSFSLLPLSSLLWSSFGRGEQEPLQSSNVPSSLPVPCCAMFHVVQLTMDGGNRVSPPNGFCVMWSFWLFLLEKEYVNTSISLADFQAAFPTQVFCLWFPFDASALWNYCVIKSVQCPEFMKGKKWLRPSS